MVVNNKNKRGRKKGKEGVLEGCLLFSSLLSCLFSQGFFLVGILVQIWLCFLCFEDSISLEVLKFLIDECCIDDFSLLPLSYWTALRL